MSNTIDDFRHSAWAIANTLFRDGNPHYAILVVRQAWAMSEGQAYELVAESDNASDEFAAYALERLLRLQYPTRDVIVVIQGGEVSHVFNRIGAEVKVVDLGTRFMR